MNNLSAFNSNGTFRIRKGRKIQETEDDIKKKAVVGNRNNDRDQPVSLPRELSGTSGEGERSSG